MCGGILMGMKQDFTLVPAHAHLNLIGWVTLALMGLYYNAIRSRRPEAWPRAQFWVSTVGIWVMIPGLALTLLQMHPAKPLVILGSLITLAGIILFAVNVFRD